MKQFLGNCTRFAFFSIVAYAVLTIVTGSMNLGVVNNLKFPIGGNGHLFSRLKELDTVKNVDILFLGSSHAYRGYDVRKFNRLGYSAFNLGSSAQTPVQTELLVKTYLAQLNPKVVILDIHP